MIYLCHATYTPPLRAFGDTHGTITFVYTLADGSRHVPQIKCNDVPLDKLRVAVARLYGALLVN